MPSESPKRSLTILDVGHGNAAVLQDEGGVVVFDTGRSGTELLRFLRECNITEIETLFLSHSDADHLGGASTLLVEESIVIRRVYLNPDSSKRTDVHLQLRYAIQIAEKLHGTVTIVGLTTVLNYEPHRRGARIEILYPPAHVAMSGVGGVELRGQAISSNSMSAVFRVGDSSASSVLLGGDAEYSCVNHWKEAEVDVSSVVLVFPHHGGNPGISDDEEITRFTQELFALVNPQHVVFSIHRTLHSLPKQQILDALIASRATVAFACTELPDRLHSSVSELPQWQHHRASDGTVIVNADIQCALNEEGFSLSLVTRFA